MSRPKLYDALSKELTELKYCLSYLDEDIRFGINKYGKLLKSVERKGLVIDIISVLRERYAGIKARADELISETKRLRQQVERSLEMVERLREKSLDGSSKESPLKAQEEIIQEISGFLSYLGKRLDVSASEIFNRVVAIDSSGGPIEKINVSQEFADKIQSLVEEIERDHIYLTKNQKAFESARMNVYQGDLPFRTLSKEEQENEAKKFWSI